MATYKVLQDIEAEDKFLGPLTLKQFIFGAIALVSAYLSFLFITKGLPLLAIPLFPLILVTGFLAFPWGRDQPTETWLLAKLRFYFKPRKRIWDQTGIQELVKINVPKVVAQYTSDNLSQDEVRQRLRALAETVDTRGWATKNIVSNPAYAVVGGNASDRLMSPTMLPSVISPVDIPDSEDIFDNPQAAQITAKIEENSQKHKNEIIEQMHKPDDARPNWFMQNNPSNDGDLPAAFKNKESGLDPNEKAFLDKIHENKSQFGQSFRNHKSLSPISDVPTQKSPVSQVTVAPDPVTIELARNNDRTVESLARETNQAHGQLDEEVIVSLH
ncbi:MAG: PrgI family protein [Candidatus Saccharibacteria bacterium]|nr:PrgI family protein [Candidatus Saccharibacteria bacterium]